MSDLVLFSGSSSQQLFHHICGDIELSPGDIFVDRFSDGEIRVELNQNVRGLDTFIIQSTSSPGNDSLLEMLLIADALRRASARRITAVIPYLGYSRQDRRTRSCRVPISAKVIADMICNVGIDRVLTVDLHAEQVQGFFSIPVDNVYASPVLLEVLKEKNYENPMVVSPDIGGVVRARAIARLYHNIDLAIIDKRRSTANESEVMNIIGKVEGHTCILVDDIVDTAGTLCHAASALKSKGAIKVVAYITHPVLSGNAVEKIMNSELDEIIVTDTIALSDEAKACSKIVQVSLSRLLSESITRVSQGRSLSALFA